MIEIVFVDRNGYFTSREFVSVEYTKTLTYIGMTVSADGPRTNGMTKNVS